MQLGDQETAEHSLEQALEAADDEQLKAMIRMNLQQLNLKEGKAPPAFIAATLDGEQISLDDFEGKVVLLDFWATWCAPCIAELPNLQRIYGEHREAGFEIVSISLDEDKQALERFLDQREMPWTHVLNTSMPEGEDLASTYGVTAIPQMILVGRDGTIAAVNPDRRWRRPSKRQCASELSVRAFCQQHALNAVSFYAWRRRLRDQALPTTDASARFVRLQPRGRGDVGILEVRFAGGTTLQCSSNHLAELVRLLKGDDGEIGSC